jgi:diguanylate cyclase (GGDEF)-like protein
MSTNKRLLTLIMFILILVSAVSSLIFAYNFKKFSIKTATDKAISIAQDVRDGLTVHMTNGIMDKREIFLHNIAKHQGVTQFHLLRSPMVIKQFGKGILNEDIATKMEKKVLDTGKMLSKYQETPTGTLLKVTIPYIATREGTPNCMQCHDAKEGDVLGALSLNIDISDIKSESISIIMDIVIVIFILMIIIILLTNYFLRPYVKLFDDLENAILQAYQGDFSYHIKTKLKNEAGKVANRLNELSEIFKFKKTIELDETKNIIYDRIIHIMEVKFNIDKFTLFEISNAKKERRVIYNSANIDANDLTSDANSCRAFRTNSTVYSTDFDNLCLNCNQTYQEYICLNYTIDENYSITLHIQINDKTELERVRILTPVINNYFNMAKPVIEGKILLGILKETTLKDPMTALYNRRFLNELLDSNITSRVKEGFVHAMLMIDIDFFKKVNDTYGHDVGDTVIKKLALIMKSAVRDSDMPVRYGGEEFIIFLPNTTKEKAVEIAENINETFKGESFSSAIEVFNKTLSIGIAYYPDDADGLWQTIKYADEALYVAKNTGRDKVVVFTKDMHTEGDDY